MKDGWPYCTYVLVQEHHRNVKKQKLQAQRITLTISTLQPQSSTVYTSTSFLCLDYRNCLKSLREMVLTAEPIWEPGFSSSNCRSSCTFTSIHVSIHESIHAYTHLSYVTPQNATVRRGGQLMLCTRWTWCRIKLLHHWVMPHILLWLAESCGKGQRCDCCF